ncbi:alpha-N-arabinofuranosidase [Aquisalinus flavus]|uniref:non-reducing end alpha-L-arabinofuranosidase n=1 Tax=Aquisalinus flavus TaxID=1526572 RepID=A0A8J2V1D0_9PROT|nr:alpha-L-arabinofuranosidase C-terminal domain-containing protein [Aquisalinus flavus]MBD0426882.1 alpha-N-arabinofuranosidase [Aquisalinus flavus]UNE46728.1 alpha-N-arabinofuranosidase [Aquisalinus flavus]GGC96708.1 alpha-L-arabinofuranosidase [Aquisalinus flavus]
MLRNTIAAFAMSTALAAVSALAVASAQTDIEIDRDAPIGTIQPEVYGQFLEHLGTQVYDGIWVGEDSDIPNTDGIRDDVYGALDRLDIPVIRWPGGCYADMYHWRDGIGAPEERTPRVNMSWGGTPEPNGFGTHEFFNLAEKLGAKTYLNVNLGTGTITEASDWLEYITATGESALAQERRANGRDEPWTIDYLSIGNETWGCGGNMRPAYYADLYAQWATLLKVEGEMPVRIISGSHEGNMDYSDEILDHPAMGDLGDGISVHFYTLPTGDWGKKGDALGFPEDEWMSTLSHTIKMDTIIEDKLAIIDSHDLGEDFHLYVDEWGMWVDGEEGAPALNQQNTIRDAVVAALNLNIFHKYADRVPMTNIAQMVNVLQAMILTDGPEMILTPTYHVYEMYVPFQGATALPVDFDSPDYSHGGETIPAVSLSAAIAENGDILIAVVNADASKAHEIALPAFGADSASVRQLTGASMDAHNSFDDPEAVSPVEMDVSATRGKLRMTLEPRSVSVMRIAQ